MRKLVEAPQVEQHEEELQTSWSRLLKLTDEELLDEEYPLSASSNAVSADVTTVSPNVPRSMTHKGDPQVVTDRSLNALLREGFPPIGAGPSTSRPTVGMQPSPLSQNQAEAAPGLPIPPTLPAPPESANLATNPRQRCAMVAYQHDSFMAHVVLPNVTGERKRKFEAEQEEQVKQNFQDAEVKYYAQGGNVFSIHIHKTYDGKRAKTDALFAQNILRFELGGPAVSLGPIPVCEEAGCLVVKFWSSEAVFLAVKARFDSGPLALPLPGGLFPVVRCELEHACATFIELEMTASSWENIRTLEGQYGDLIGALSGPGRLGISDTVTSLMTISPDLDDGWLCVSAPPQVADEATREGIPQDPKPPTPLPEKGEEISPGLQARTDSLLHDLLHAKGRDEAFEYDVVVVTPASARDTAQRLAGYLNTRTHLVTSPLSGPPASSKSTPAEEVAHVVLNARRGVVVVLTKGSMTDAGCILGMLSADEAAQNVLLLHMVAEVPFPGYDEQPKSSVGRLSQAFDSKAVVYLQQYEESCFARVAAQLKGLPPRPSPEGAEARKQAAEQAARQCSHLPGPSQSGNTEDPQSPSADGTPLHLRRRGKMFRLFLSHRQLSGRYAVHRTHEALRAEYRCFLDVEAGGLKLHNLVQLVKCSHTLVVYLSDGYFDSQYCVLELAVAAAHELDLVLVRDYRSCVAPPELGDDSRFAVTLRKAYESHGGDRQGVFRGLELSELQALVAQKLAGLWPRSIVYHPELFADYLKSLRRRLGPSDHALEVLSRLKDSVKLETSTGDPLVGSDLIERSLGAKHGIVALDDVSCVTTQPPITDGASLFRLCRELWHLGTLNLSGSKLQDAGTTALGAALADLLSLRQLDLAGNSIQASGARAIAAAVAVHPALRQLVMRSNPIGPEGLEALSGALGSSPQGPKPSHVRGAPALQLLDLGYTKAVTFTHERTAELAWERKPGSGREQGVAVLALAEALSRDPPLQSLLLDGNQLMVRSVPEQLGLLDGVEALGRALGFNSTLTHVSLRDNVIKTRGAEALAAGLALNRSVRSLDVRENFMHGRGAPALAATAVSHPALLSFSGIPLDKLRANAAQCLDLGGMKVGTPGFLALSRVLPDCRSLTTLVLDDTWEADRRGSREMQSARKQVMQALGGALKETSTLTALSLRGNALNPECAAMLAAGLAASRALTSLDLSDNALGEAASEDDTRSFRMQHPDLSVYPGRDVPFCASGGKADHGDSSGDDTPPLLEFAEAVATNGTLRTVDLLGNQIKERGIELLLGAVRRTALLPSVCGIPPEATEADLSRRELTPYDAMLLAAELELRGEVSMRELATRAMAHTETTGASTAVSEGGAPWTLTALNLAHNRIFLTGEEHDPRVASRLADILAQEMDGGALTSLNLWGNHMSCADAEALVGAVRQRRLRMKLCGDLLDAVDVDLHQKQRTVAKVILVANDLALEPVVQSLDLSAEMQGFHTTSSERNEDIVALAGALVFNHRLTTLDLS
eukprot:gene18396-21942_t